MSYPSEDALQRAIDATLSGTSARKASAIYGVAKSTLLDRLRGKQPKKIAQSRHQRLSPYQETRLVDWILAQGALGFPPTHAQIRLFAQRIINLAGDTQPLGRHWMDGFLARNPSVKTIRGKAMDNKRVNGATTENIQAFFHRLNHPTIKSISQRNRWKMDETGLMQAQRGNGLVVGISSRKKILMKGFDSREWVTIIECISATGESIRPLVIFRGKTLQQQHYPDNNLEDYASWDFEPSDNGWTSNEIALKWLKRSFLPGTARDPPEPRLLIMDGHGSHQTDEFMWECFQNDVFALYLPAHTSHVLQPLDLSVFGVVKAIYRREVGNAALEDDTTPYGKEKFLSCYKIARETALAPRTVRNGWQATGLWPVNSAKPLMSPLLLENRNKALSTPQPQPIIATDTSYSWPGLKPLVTPQKSGDIQTLLSDVKGQLTEGSTTARLLFRKTGKSLDMKNMLIANLQAEVAVLRARNADKILKRKRVEVEDPNNRFATIEDIMRAKRQMIDISEESAEEEDEDDTDIEDEIVVAG